MLLYLDYLRTPKYYQNALEVLGLTEAWESLQVNLCKKGSREIDHPMPWF